MYHHGNPTRKAISKKRIPHPWLVLSRRPNGWWSFPNHCWLMCTTPREDRTHPSNEILKRMITMSSWHHNQTITNILLIWVLATVGLCETKKLQNDETFLVWNTLHEENLKFVSRSRVGLMVLLQYTSLFKVYFNSKFLFMHKNFFTQNENEHNYVTNNSIFRRASFYKMIVSDLWNLISD